jgi:hypothetical protein
MKRSFLAAWLLASCTAEDKHLMNPDLGAEMDAGLEPDMMPPGNRNPVAGDDEAETFAGVAVDIDVLDNDGDPDGDNVLIDEVMDGDHGTANKTGGIVRYTPNDAIYVGEDTLTYTIKDGHGGTAEGTVTVTIVEPPTIVITDPLDGATISGTDTITVTFMVNGCAFQVPSSGGECHAHKFLDGAGYPTTGGIGVYTIMPFDVTGLSLGVHVFRLSLAKNDGTDQLFSPEIFDEISFTVE